jgi:hypothetical protein
MLGYNLLLFFFLFFMLGDWVVEMGGVGSTKICGVTVFVLFNPWQFSL